MFVGYSALKENQIYIVFKYLYVYISYRKYKSIVTSYYYKVLGVAQ